MTNSPIYACHLIQVGTWTYINTVFSRFLFGGFTRKLDIKWLHFWNFLKQSKQDTSLLMETLQLVWLNPVV